MIGDPWFYVAAVPAVLIVGISKGGFGGTLGLVAVPLMALVIAPTQAAAIMLPILCLMDLFGVHAYWGRWDGPNMRILVPAALVGIGAGALAFERLDADAIRLLVGAIAVGFTTRHYWVGWRRAAPPPAGRSVAKGGFWGAVSGFTSFVAHAGGPPLNVYLLPQRLDRTLYVGTTVVFFILVNYAKLVPYAWLGQFDRETLLTALVLAPLAPVGIRLGLWLHGRVNDALFYRICYLLLVGVGLKLMWDGAVGSLE